MHEMNPGVAKSLLVWSQVLGSSQASSSRIETGHGFHRKLVFSWTYPLVQHGLLENPLVIIRWIFPSKTFIYGDCHCMPLRPKKDTCHPTRTPHQSLMHLRLHFGEASHEKSTESRTKAARLWSEHNTRRYHIKHMYVYILCIYIK